MVTHNTAKIILGIIFIYFFVFINVSTSWGATAGYQQCTADSTCTVGEYVYDDDYSPLNDAVCTITSRYPDGTVFLNEQSMPVSGASDGWYSHTFSTAGKTLGVYRSHITCVADGETMRLDKTFRIESAKISSEDVTNAVWNATASAYTINGSFGGNLQDPVASVESIWNYPTRTLTNFGTLLADIWNYSDRSLSNFGTLISAIWNNTTRTLTGGELDNGEQLATKTDIDLATSSATLTIKGAANQDLTQINTALTNAQSSLDSIETIAETLDTKVDTVQTTTTTTLTKWGSYSMSDVISYVDDLETRLGTTNDSCASTTVFGDITCIRDAWGAQTADSLYTAANNAATLSAALRAELDYNGKSSTAYQDLQAIKTNVSAMNTSVGSASDLSSAITVFGKIQGAREDIASGVVAIKGPENKNLSDVTTQVAGVQATTDSISNKIDSLDSKVTSISTTTSTILQKWGSYSFSDIVSSVSAVTTGLGTESDTCLTNTVFGQIACVQDKWGVRTAADLYTAANNAEVAATALRTELDYNGKSSTAYQDLQTLLGRITTIQTLIGTTSDAKTVASLYGKLAKAQDTIENLDTSGAGLSDLLDKWGSYTATDIYTKIGTISTSVTYNNSIPNVSEILNITQANATNLESLMNSVLALQALTQANKTLLLNGTAQPIVQSWMEKGSIIFKTLITNPSPVTQNVPFKFYLPKEATKKDIEKIDDDLSIGFDAAQDAYYVSGKVQLAPNQTHIYSVEVTDVWHISPQQTDSLKLQAKELYEPLKGTSYFAQGATLYADIIASLDTATNLQNQAQTPEDKIKAYREAIINVNKAKSEIEDLKTLNTSAGATNNLLGFVGGVQTTAVWGIVLILTAGFIFLAIYMRVLTLQASKLENTNKDHKTTPSEHSQEKIKSLKKIFTKKVLTFTGALTCLIVLAILLIMVVFTKKTPIDRPLQASPATKEGKVTKIQHQNTPGKTVLGVEAPANSSVMIVVGETNGINIRQGPSTLTTIIKRITKDSQVKKINELDGWTQIEMTITASESALLRGWVKNDYIENRK